MDLIGPVFRPSLVVAAILAAYGATAGAQEESPSKRAWSIVPSVTVQETYSDNTNLSASNTKSDWITEIAPGVRVDSRTARLTLHVDYRLRELLYANNSRGDQTQNSLNSFGKLEAIENLLFVDVSGNVWQQSISAFGSPSAANYSVNANSTETSSFRVSPYLRGRLAGYADYELRYSDSRTRSDANAAADVNAQAWSGYLAGATPLTALGWSVNFNQQKNDYVDRRDYESRSWRGMLTYSVTPQFKLSLSGGRERNDYTTPDLVSYNTHGYGFDWRPTERSQISAFKEKRFFGDGHTLTINHRMRRSALRFADSRDVSILPPQASKIGLGTNYDVLSYELMSEYPNEAERDVAVRNLLNLYGLDPNAVVTTDFISGQATVRRRQELSYIISGIRNMVTLSLVRSRDERLGTAIVVGGNDFSTTSTVNQRGINLNWGHQLSGISTLNVSAGHSRSTSGSDLDVRRTQRSLSATVSTRLGARTRGSVSARRTEYSGTTSPYSENALSGSVSVEF